MHIPRKHLLFLLLVALCSSLLTSCGNQVEKTPDTIVIQSGASQTAAPGEECSKELVVAVMGPVRRTMLGGEGKRKPALGIKLRITPATDGASVTPAEGETDAGGNFRCRIKLARKFGDQYFKIECPGYEDVKPLYLHAIAGVTVAGEYQETVAGENLMNPIELTVVDENGAPSKGVPVFFSLKSGSSKARLSVSRAVTNAQGKVHASLKTAEDYTGKYEILAEVGEGEERTRGIVITTLAINRFNVLIGILGGLGIFIFGMTIMSEGLQQIAGDKLKTLLQLFTSNKLKAMLAGLVVTSLIQSSGACTVMVVGFVNAALLSLEQAIGIILGASVGTTVTAQMVSLKLDAVALPTIAIGVVCMLIAKKSQAKGIAITILGFGLLFYGMMFMSTQMKVISDFPTFISFFSKFECTPADGSFAPPFFSVLGAVLVGMVMTIIVQSSSATVGVAIALADSGLLSFYTAVPLILGDNIGSTITGLMASLNASKSSRQAALAATIFKVLGVLIILPFLYLPWGGKPAFLVLIDAITSGDVFAQVPENIGRHLASAHTVFNIINVAIFLPFVNVIAMMAKFLVPQRAGDQAGDPDDICHLEERLLNTPSAALTQVMTALNAMTEASVSLTRKTISAVLDQKNAIPEEEVARLENRIDHTQHSIIGYLVMLTRHNLNISQSNAIPIFMHCVNDVERIGDRAVNIYQLLPAMREKSITFSQQAVDEIREIDLQLNKMATTLLDGVHKNDMDTIQKVIAMHGEIKFMTARFEQSHESRLAARDCTVEKGLVFVELLSNLERISGHLANVAERAKDILPHSVIFTSSQDNTRK